MFVACQQPSGATAMRELAERAGVNERSSWSTCDLVHARLVLIHLPQAADVVRTLARAVRPQAVGGARSAPASELVGSGLLGSRNPREGMTARSTVRHPRPERPYLPSMPIRPYGCCRISPEY